MFVSYCISFVDISLYHFTEYALTSDIPDLQGYVHIVWHFQSFHIEIAPNGLFVGLCEVVLTEAHDN